MPCLGLLLRHQKASATFYLEVILVSIVERVKMVEKTFTCKQVIFQESKNSYKKLTGEPRPKADAVLTNQVKKRDRKTDPSEASPSMAEETSQSGRLKSYTSESKQKCFAILRVRAHYYKLIMAPGLEEMITERVESCLELQSDDRMSNPRYFPYGKNYTGRIKIRDQAPISCLGIKITSNTIENTISFVTEKACKFKTRELERFIGSLRLSLDGFQSELHLYESALEKGIPHLWFNIDHLGRVSDAVSQKRQDILNKDKPEAPKQTLPPSAMAYSSLQNFCGGGGMLGSGAIPLGSCTSLPNMTLPTTPLVNSDFTDSDSDEKYIFSGKTYCYKKYRKKMIKSYLTKEILKSQIRLKPSFKDMVQNCPESWTNAHLLGFKTSMYYTIDLDLTSREAHKIIREVNRGSESIKLDIIKIEKIHNLLAFDKYQQQKALLELKYPEDKEIEKYLFHGTKNNDPELIMSSEVGFDVRYSDNGSLGRGTYFSSTFMHSHGCAYKDQIRDKTYHQVFFARVLTGKQATNQPSIRGVEPPIDPKTGLKYDSMASDIQNGKQHVVYENGRSYPEYCITYTVDDPNCTDEDYSGYFSNAGIYATSPISSGIPSNTFPPFSNLQFLTRPPPFLPPRYLNEIQPLNPFQNSNRNS
ncbi:unnamed protein product [Moneuplotes crassus]|uniref:Poly [ADP-ribose] polymerase n=1 Tax=Euplotes crassus TaxID=5936 RepID=A0AAD1Y702_EUPCR|nr:unnamed protein product [Moneuplotes crassus]